MSGTIAQQIESTVAMHIPGSSTVEVSKEAKAIAEDVIKKLLSETGCSDIAEVIDMVKVGQSLMHEIEHTVQADAQLKGWAPAEDPAEIVADLINMRDDAARAGAEVMREMAAKVIKGRAVDEKNYGARYREWPEYGSGNRSTDDELTKFADAMSAAIGALEIEG